MEDRSYRARLAQELMVRCMAQSRHFWIDLCGLEVVHKRDEEGFVFLDRNGAVHAGREQELGPSDWPSDVASIDEVSNSSK